MSSIMNRLRDVEGVSSPRRSPEVGGREIPFSVTRNDRDAPLNVSESDNRRGTFPTALRFRRAVAGLLVIFAVFIIWRTWSGHVADRSASGKRVAAQRIETDGLAEARLAASASEQQHLAEEQTGTVLPATPLESIANVEPEKKERMTDLSATNAVSKGAATDDSLPLGTALRASPGSQETVLSLEVAESRSADVSSAREKALPEAKSPATSQPSSAEAVIPQVREVLTPEEDERTKSFLLKLKISGVYKDADGYVALINGGEFQKGQKLGQTDIVQITSERVTFAYKGKRYHLPIR
ncbi:hypothetical protein HQ563_03700 [bacterium]|nr:hypothetical protein [bacterium]